MNSWYLLGVFSPADIQVPSCNEEMKSAGKHITTTISKSNESGMQQLAHRDMIALTPMVVGQCMLFDGQIWAIALQILTNNICLTQHLQYVIVLHSGQRLPCLLCPDCCILVKVGHVKGKEIAHSLGRKNPPGRHSEQICLGPFLFYLVLTSRQEISLLHIDDHPNLRSKKNLTAKIQSPFVWLGMGGSI